MKKRIFSLLLVLCMIVALLPVTAAAASAKYYTVEKYDAEGNGTMLIPPTETTNWSGRYGTTFITSLLGSGNVTMSNDAVTGIKDADGTWLNNDGDSKWYIATNYNKEVYLDSTYFRASNADVLRFIYVPNGDFSKAGMTTEGADWADALMSVDKSELIKTLSAYNGVALGTNRQAAYDAGIAAIVNIDATDDDVAAAKTNMETAEDNAGSITLNKEATELYVGQKETLTATLEPAGSTDVLNWTSSDESIVAVEDGVLKGMSAGTATVTVEAGGLGLTDTIEVTVNALQGLYITKVNSNASSTIEAKKEELLLTAFAEPDGIENLDWQWSVENPSIAQVTPMEGNEYLATVSGKAEGTTNVVVTLGSMTATFEVTVTPYQGPYVYFDYADSSKADQRLDENNTITLSSLDVGSFKVANADGTARWSCSGNVPAPTAEYPDAVAWHSWINSETGLWTPSGTQPVTANVDTTDGFTATFTINYQVASGITELKNVVNGQEVSTENPFSMEGKGRAGIATEGLLDGEWITVPQQALKYTTSDTTGNIRILGNELILGAEGQATLTATLLGESVSSSFKAQCKSVPLTGFTITTPETFTITGEKNFMNDQYYGLELYSPNLVITYEPSNTTQTELEWECLTPDIAFYTVQHNAGIVPKRCGTAQFLVTSKSNAELKQTVTVTFKYTNPLQNVSLEKDAYELEVDQTEALNFTFTPENATDKALTYSYDTDGIVEIKGNTLLAKSVGQVTVTATPSDQTEGCQSFTFTVTVKNSGSQEGTPVDVADDIAHGLAYLGSQSMSKFNDEWTIFTVARAGGTISQENKDAYFASVKAKLDEGGVKVTEYDRLILTLGALGKDPTKFEGYNLVEALYNHESAMSSELSTVISFALMALDSKDYSVPADASWTREAIITELLGRQIRDGENSGAFDLYRGGTRGGVDATGMALQALAPYNNDAYPAVQTAFANAQVYLKNKLTSNAGYVEGNDENSCTAAQAVVALCAAGIDPTDPDNGYTFGTKNLITNLHQFRDESGGFKLYTTEGLNADLMSTQQTTYALVAYQRFTENRASLYDLSDVEFINVADDAQITVTISNAGTLVMAQEEVTVTDRNEDGMLSVNEALYAAHEAGYAGGADAGYLATSNGTVTRLWGVDTYGVGFFLNHGSCNSANDEVEAGDNLVAWIYEDTTAWSDAYGKWTDENASATTGTAMTVSLEKAGYDDNWNVVFSAMSGATIKAYNADLTEANVCTVTDNEDGTYAVTFTTAGEYYLVATGNDSTILVPTVRKVSVAQGAATTIPGDLNGDKLVDGDDVMYVYTLITSGTTLTEEQVAQLDITEDGWVDGDDVMAIYLLTLK